MKKTIGMAAVVVLASLSLAACGEKADDKGGPSASSSKTAEQIDFKACEVSDSGVASSEGSWKTSTFPLPCQMRTVLVGVPDPTINE